MKVATWVTYLEWDPVYLRLSKVNRAKSSMVMTPLFAPIFRNQSFEDRLLSNFSYSYRYAGAAGSCESCRAAMTLPSAASIMAIQ